MKMLLFTLFLWLWDLANVMGSIHDCWDPEKLRRMKFSANKDPATDPGLSQFSKMVQCLTSQGKGIGGTLEKDWTQWAKAASGGGFAPNWNDPQMNSGGGRDQNNVPNWRRKDNNNNWRDNDNNNNRYQPQPGVHPDDWGRVRTDDRDRDLDWGNRGRRPPTDSSSGDLWDDQKGGSGGSGGKKRKKERKLEQEKRRKMMQQENNPSQRFDQATWNNPNPMNVPVGTDYSLMTPEETAAISMSRKYGYVIMAFSVVVLAVLMVATIFFCNSSNSTMSQAANQNLPVNQFDTYSIYSYKGGAGGGMGVSDTLRSTATLGGMSMHTETLKSQNRGSPQYRVSDIDPDFARRFKETQQY